MGRRRATAIEETSGSTLVRADCLGHEGLRSLGRESVDVVICDPPYSEHVHHSAMRGVKGKRRRIAEKSDLGFPHLLQKDMNRIARQLARVARRWVLVFCDVESSTAWAKSLVRGGLDYIRTGAWVRVASAPQFSGDRPAAGFEAIVICHRKGAKEWNGGGSPAVWTHPIVGADGDRRLMPTQKPRGLMEVLVRQFSHRGDLVCDPFAGAGSTGVAALRLGRRFLGWESDPRIHAIAARRLGRTREQLDLFDGRSRKA